MREKSEQTNCFHTAIIYKDRKIEKLEKILVSNCKKKYLFIW